MTKTSLGSRLLLLLAASRPKFLPASAAPVLVGSALGYAVAGVFQVHLFVLALLGIMALQAGANAGNDYFDHLSRNDWLNENPTPFSGGGRLIQQGVLSPRATLLAALFYLAVGAVLGLFIVVLTQSLLILVIGLVGLLGGFFYTAGPIRLGYRGVGEFVIALLFGMLPVYAAYYLQTGTVDLTPFLPAVVVSILIFLVIFVNEFPDLAADAQVNKKTLIVMLGVSPCVWIYRIALVASFAVAALVLIQPAVFFAGLVFLLTAPVGVLAMKAANKTDLAKPGQYRASQLTVMMHTVGSLALTVGALISSLT